MLQSLASFDDDVICVLLTFCEVFHVVDQDGNKLYDGQVIDRIELVKYTRINSKNRAKLCTFVLILIWFFQSLGAGSLSFRAPPERSVEVEAEAAAAQTAIELIGKDRPGLLSEVFAVLTDLKCNIVSSEVWTHDARMAALVHVTDADTLEAIDNQDRLDTVKRLLRHLLRGGAPRARPKATARAAIPAPRRARGAHAAPPPPDDARRPRRHRPQPPPPPATAAAAAAPSWRSSTAPSAGTPS